MRNSVAREHARSRSFPIGKLRVRMTSLWGVTNGFRGALVFLLGGLTLPLFSCSQAPDPNTLVMMIESSPTNLDPRVGIDGQSERIDELIFDALLTRDEHFNVQPGLAERWEIPDPLTYIFHLHRGVLFHDGRPLTSRDVKWTFDSLLQGKIRSTKTSTYRYVNRIDTPDDLTVAFHLKEPFAALLWNLSEGAIGIVPYGSLDEMTRNPIGTGPFKFVSAETDKEVILQRNDAYWGEAPHLARVRFAVVPDATTEALELRKGSADLAINSPMPPDTVVTLERYPSLVVQQGPGTGLGLPGIQSARSHLARCPGPPGHRLRSGSRSHDEIPLAQSSPAGAERSAAAKLGVQRRRARTTITTPARPGNFSTPPDTRT
jgi:ABC-type transport system substrate-binding protein